MVVIVIVASVAFETVMVIVIVLGIETVIASSQFFRTQTGY